MKRVHAFGDSPDEFAPTVCFCSTVAIKFIHSMVLLILVQVTNER